ncbi:MAG: VanZ family protein [Alphaproteobacteria bacterium]|nr:VanZ family protein [Alphaproteobacteria bacterium]
MLVAVAIIVAVIVYGSLYPFTFRRPEAGAGPLRNLLQSWAETPHRGDFVANVFLYLPLGFFGSLASAGRGRALPRVMLVTLAGGALSVTMELAQYFIAERVSAAVDVYANLTGTMLGAMAGNIAGGDLFLRSFRQAAAQRVPCLLLALWLGYRLYPYVPTIDLHKYWQAVRPVFLYPRPSEYDLFRYSALWLTVGSLLEELGGARRGRLLFLPFIIIVLAAKVVIVGKTLSAAEIAGAAGALAFSAALAVIAGERIRVRVVTLIFAACVVAERLAPFQFTMYGREFVWVPFHSFLYGSLELNVISFLEKAFLYGALIWLLHRSGLPLAASVGLVATMLGFTSWAETYLPGRSAEITDALMALLIGAILAVVKTPGADSRKGTAEMKQGV